jgi:hypothetical protein
MEFIPVVVVDEWLPIVSYSWDRSREYDRRQTLDHTRDGKLFFCVSERSGVFKEISVASIGDNFVVVSVNDDVD